MRRALLGLLRRSPLGIILALLALWFAFLTWETSWQPLPLPTRVLAPPNAQDRVLLFAPHEDDESISAAAYLYRAATVGAQVHVCLLTNGEGEELGAVFANRSLRLNPARFQRLGQVRQRETRRALAQVGVAPDNVIFLGYPNRGLDAMWSAGNWDYQNPYTSRFLKATSSPYPNSLTPHASFCGAQVMADLRAVINRVRPTRILTCHPADRHPDHWPSYGFVRLALDSIGCEPGGDWVRAVPVYTYLVHRSGWPLPYGSYPDEPLSPPAALEALAANRWLSFPVTPEELQLKRGMLATYRSQAAAFDLLIKSFVRTNELFAVLPELMPAETEEDADRAPAAAEAVGDSKALRKLPQADIAAVSCFVREQRVRVRIRLAAPPTGRTVTTALVNLPATGPQHLQALQISWVPGDPPAIVGATSHYRLPAGELPPILVLQRGRTLEVSIPRQVFTRCDRFNLDVLTRNAERTWDHALTRVYVLPPEETGQPPRPAL